MLKIEGKSVCESLEEVVSPDRAVLAIIDIENSDIWSKGCGRAMLERVRELTVAARNAGLPVIFFYNTRGPRLQNISPAYLRVLMNLGSKPEELAEQFKPDNDQMRVHPDLDPQPRDIIIPKDRGDAFEGTNFELLLRTCRRETVVLVGCSTDWCLEATAWAATNKDYYVVIVEDCVSSHRPDGHEAALKQFRTIGLDVVASPQLLDIWGLSF